MTLAPVNRILVTGGAGFVGSHLVDLLLLSGVSVIVLDDFSTGNLRNLAKHSANSNLQVIQGSLLDEDLVANLVNDCHQVYHLAAAVGVNRIMKDPIGSLKVNIFGTELLLESCMKKQRPVLITSTSEIYGKSLNGTLSEEDDRVLGSPEKYRWLYSEAKAIDEAIAFVMGEKYGLKFKIVRLFNTVGPRQSGEYGMVIPRFVQAAREDKPIEIYGNGQQTRCFTHVSDVVQALYQLMQSPSAYGEAYNVGNPSETSIFELAKLVLTMTNSKSELIFRNHTDIFEHGFEDMQRRVPNISKIKRAIGWQPRYSIEEIIRDILDFNQ